MIKTEAKRFGFLSYGVSKAHFLEEEARKLETWLKNNLQGEKQNLENPFNKRLHPNKLVEDSK